MGGDAESGKVLRAVHKKVVDQQLRSECSRLIGVAQPLAGAWLQAIPGPNHTTRSKGQLRGEGATIRVRQWSHEACR